MNDRRRTLSDRFDAMERAGLAVLAAAMVILALLQIVLRSVFGTGWPWIEPALGILLLWTALAGAVAATGRRRHIAMDLLSHLLPPRAATALRVPVNLVAAFICGALSAASVGFIRLQSETETGRLFGLPVWWASCAMPAAFGLMSLRFLLHAVFALRETVRPAADRGESESP